LADSEHENTERNNALWVSGVKNKYFKKLKKSKDHNVVVSNYSAHNKINY